MNSLGQNSMEGPFYVPVPLSKAERAVIQEGLSKLPQGFAADVHAKLEATRCEACGGNGYASYVGGDDDDARCEECNGSGFVTTPLQRLFAQARRDA